MISRKLGAYYAAESNPVVLDQVIFVYVLCLVPVLLSSPPTPSTLCQTPHWGACKSINIAVNQTPRLSSATETRHPSNSALYTNDYTNASEEPVNAGNKRGRGLDSCWE
jgi:hypothetical protein